MAPLIKFKTDDEVIKWPMTLLLDLLVISMQMTWPKFLRLQKHLMCMLGVNTGAISEAALPFGGVGESGFGRRVQVRSRRLFGY